MASGCPFLQLEVIEQSRGYTYREYEAAAPPQAILRRHEPHPSLPRCARTTFLASVDTCVVTVPALLSLRHL